MEQITLSDPEIRTALEEHKSACVNMGYQIIEFDEAVKEIRNRGLNFIHFYHIKIMFLYIFSTMYITFK
jgi:uncharacterized Fe-S cluster-containing MiaB family protein